LKLAMTELGTAPLLPGNIRGTGLSATTFPLGTNQAGVRVFRQDLAEALLAKLAEFWSVSLYHHALFHLENASSLGLTRPFDLDET